MNVHRTALVAAIAVVAGALSLVATSTSSQAVDDSRELTPAQVKALTPTQPMKGRAWIQGVVKDQFGDPLGNVRVQATSNDDEGSAITYEKPGIAGSTGFYRIYDLLPGTYTLVFSGKDPKITSTTATVKVGKREIGKVSVTVTRVLGATDLSASLQRKSVTTKQSGVVEATLTTSATKKPTGRVEVREGRDVVGKGSFSARDGGELTITLDRLPRGSHALRAYFLGSSSLKASASKSFTLVVTKARR